MLSKLISRDNHSIGLTSPDDVAIVRSKYYNNLKTDFNAHIPSDGVGKFDTIGERTSENGVVIDGVKLKDNGLSLLTGGLSFTPNVITKTVLTTLTATEIVGTSAGDLGHASGAILVSAPGSGYVLQFISAVLIYQYNTAAYTGGANDFVINVGSVAATSVIADADLITASGDKVVNVMALSAGDYVLGVNSTINATSTAITQPGSAAGVLRVYITYNVIATGL